MSRGMFRPAVALGRFLCWLTRVVPGVSGTTFPSIAASRLDPALLDHFTFGENTKIVMVTGTSGKTTTTGMLAELIRSEGKTICTNAVGANMAHGVATALLSGCDARGRVDAEYVVLEVDERFLALIADKLHPDTILVTNVLKDQSQRNGEPGVILKKIAAAIGPQTRLILNRDEPNAASLGLGRENVSWYGVQGVPAEAAAPRETDVACSCPACGGVIRYEYENLLDIGKFACTRCGLHSPEDATVLRYDPEAREIAVGERRFPAKFVSADFRYCYASMLAFAAREGFSDEGVARSIAAFTLQTGRVEDMRAGDKTIHYLRIKQETPVTLQSALNVTAADPDEKIVVFDLSELVDFTPNYAGVYYAYDCDYAGLTAANVKRYICMSNVICYDEATRLVLEGVDPAAITVLPTNSYDALLQELEGDDCRSVYLLTWMHSYFDCRKSVEKYQKQRGAEA